MVKSQSGTWLRHGLGEQQPPVNARDILGVDVAVLERQAALALISRAITVGKHSKITFLNAHGANLAWNDAEFRSTLKDFNVLADGIGVDLASLINFGEKFPTNLNGTDFIPEILAGLAFGVRVALLGAQPGVAELAAERLHERYPKHEFIVAGHGYFSPIEEAGLISYLARTKPDVLLVALGNPMQEKWIARHCNGELCTVAIGVGAFFDFAAGRVPRAPLIVRRARFEWLFRLALEPRRMWMRYIVGNPLFIARSVQQKFRLGRFRKRRK